MIEGVHETSTIIVHGDLVGTMSTAITSATTSATPPLPSPLFKATFFPSQHVEKAKRTGGQGISHVSAID
jgi:hypothetical protein